MTSVSDIKTAIIQDPENHKYNSLGYQPIFSVDPKAKIALISQAPGIKAQLTEKAWWDKSGNTLRKWLNVSIEEFYNPENFAILPLDFYFPGHSKQGDLPPRISFAQKWHPRILEFLPRLKLKILIGSYAQKLYLPAKHKFSLTSNVLDFKEFLPDFFPIPHPSGRNFYWTSQNPWFETDVVPTLQSIVRSILNK